jgi:hypothetical protein
VRLRAGRRRLERALVRSGALVVVGDTDLDAAGDGVSERGGHRVADRAGKADVVQGEVEAAPGVRQPAHEPLGDGLGALRPVLERPGIQHSLTLPLPLD